MTTLLGLVGNQFGDMGFPVGRLHGVEKGMISAVNTVQYGSDVERVGQGQHKMVKASPSEQVIPALRPEGQEEASHVKTVGETLQLRDCAGLEWKHVGNTRVDGAWEQRQSEVVQERDHPCLWAPGRIVDLILIKNGS